MVRKIVKSYIKLSPKRFKTLETKYERDSNSMDIGELAEYFRYLFEISSKKK